MQQTTLDEGAIEDQPDIEYSYAHHDIPKEDVTLLKEPVEDGAGVILGTAIVEWGGAVYAGEVEPDGNLPHLVGLNGVDLEEFVNATEVHRNE